MHKDIIIETLINEYWMYDHEPAHVIRFSENGKIYLFGKGLYNSIGIMSKRAQNNWLEPTEEQIMKVEKILEQKTTKPLDANHNSQ